MKDDKPNIILITTDQQRYDTLGATGNLLIRTPHLDALVQRGVLFHHAYCQNPTCIPSRACIQTGRYTHQHGVMHMENVIDTSPGLPDWEKTFMEHLQEVGYYTAAFGKIHMMPPKGFHQTALTGGKGARWTQSEGLPIGPGPLGHEYANWLESRYPGAYERIYEQRRRPEYSRQRTAIKNILPLDGYVDYWIADNAVKFLQDPPREPFFLWCGFCGPHGPFDPPEPYDSMYPLGSIPLPSTYLADVSGKPSFHASRQRGFRPAQDDIIIRRVIAYYWGLVTLIDDMIGRIMSVMDKRGLWDNTIVVFTSDHGDMMGDYGMMGKSIFYEPVIRMPLIAVVPDSTNTPSTFDGLVELIDLAPTFLDYAGIEPPDVVQGKSFRPIMDGSKEGKGAVLCEYVSNDQEIRGKCIRTERHKYVFWGRGEIGEFYDLGNDPEERHNLYEDPAYRSEVQEHEILLLDLIIHSEKPYHGNRVE
jgi:arylsulfatase